MFNKWDDGHSAVVRSVQTIYFLEYECSRMAMTEKREILPALDIEIKSRDAVIWHIHLYGGGF